MKASTSRRYIVYNKEVKQNIHKLPLPRNEATAVFHVRCFIPIDKFL